MQEETKTEKEPKAKKVRVNENEKEGGSSSNNNNNRSVPKRIDTGLFSKIPPELFPHILKFLSSEVPLLFFFFLTHSLRPCIRLLAFVCCNRLFVVDDVVQDLIACALVCRFLTYAASDEFLWRRL